MAMPRSSNHPFDVLVRQAAEQLADRLNSMLDKVVPASRGGGRKSGGAPGGASANERRSRAMKGRKLDMSCRVDGCKNRSGGPLHGYMCADHQKLPKKAQQAARDAWRAKHAA
jgi:hypothetical protein